MELISDKLLFVRYLLFLTFFLVHNFRGNAQKDTVYFSREMNIVPSSELAEYYIIIPQSKKELTVEIIRLNSLKKCGGIELTKNKLSGPFEVYHENGAKHQSGSLKKGKLDGWIEFYDIGNEFQRAEFYHPRKGMLAQYYFSESGKKVYSIAKRMSRFGHKYNDVKASNRLGNYINSNLEIPNVANDIGDPTVMVSFLINPKGEVEEVKISNSIHPDLDQAAVRVIEKMPNWFPAKHQGKYVYSEFSVSIRF